MHLVNFIIRIYHDAWSHERQIISRIPVDCALSGSHLTAHFNPNY